MNNLAQAAPVQLSTVGAASKQVGDKILIGKDVLELLTGAMYIDPLCIFREYIQNSCDSIDEAQALNVYRVVPSPRIDIIFDQSERSVRIRDNGLGIDNQDFVRILTAIGGSHKRGLRLRGFRGVGRLSGLGYCQELVFRSRAKGERTIGEMVWDGRKLKEVLRTPGSHEWLDDAIREVTKYRFLPATDYPEHFFEVELRKVTRVRNDLLMNEGEVRSYLAQVAPVPFAPSFKFSAQLNAFLDQHQVNCTFQIQISDGLGLIYRPHADTFAIGGTATDHFTGIRTFAIEGIDGEKAAVGWFLDHSYLGAIAKRAGVGGFRLRSGNIQVGSSDLVAHLFPESRFNGWCVGEMHVVLDKVVPNGRRDDFEPSVHYQNLLGGLAPFARIVAKACRDQSILRNRLRKADAMVTVAGEALGLLKGSTKHDFLVEIVAARVKRICQELKRLSEVGTLGTSEKELLDIQISDLESKLTRAMRKSRRTSVLKRLHATKRVAYEHVLRLIYELSPKLREAHDLSERILKAIRKDLAARDF
jgi:molecular chaperone HtpG